MSRDGKPSFIENKTGPVTGEVQQRRNFEIGEKVKVRRSGDGAIVEGVIMSFLSDKEGVEGRRVYVSLDHKRDDGTWEGKGGESVLIEELASLNLRDVTRE